MGGCILSSEVSDRRRDFYEHTRLTRPTSCVPGVTMTTVTELPAAYESRQEDEVISRPVEPVTPLMLACQQENDQEVRRILSSQVSGVDVRL